MTRPWIAELKALGEALWPWGLLAVVLTAAWVLAGVRTLWMASEGAR